MSRRQRSLSTGAGRYGVATAVCSAEASPEGGARLSPKRPRAETSGLADVFSYYAGFSFDWALATILEDSQRRSQTILDPWNGSGTTSHASAVAGVRCIAVDLNPVANVLARLRSNDDALRIEDSPGELPSGWSRGTEPLSLWFVDDCARRLRQWRSASYGFNDLCTLAVFSVVKQLTRGFEGSNPTWVRKARTGEEKVHSDQVDELVRREQSRIVSRLQEQGRILVKPSIIRASASALPVPDRSVDKTVSSPPYLTRIDYGVAYSRELAVLGHNIFGDRALRSSLTGTTLIRPAAPWQSQGPTADKLLKAVTRHSSKDSSGYYRKQLLQYLSDLSEGLREIDRVSKPGASATLVVQDSYYKDVPINLASICAEHFTMRGWRILDFFSFPVTRLLTTLNTSARSYAKGSVNETVITARKDT